ncbi:hypothetical protein C8F04DRAFT_1236431 [Mycena alexandri]|uniref:Uncharacterized protein n=1 Tax=Mycena alexandri TaxID=1745969 RepID=A0AAD6SN33_9AGAR|nr:hypothetical protein C8F04DRAFT_1236431 [Mycena alexandri]
MAPKCSDPTKSAPTSGGGILLPRLFGPYAQTGRGYRAQPHLAVLVGMQVLCPSRHLDDVSATTRAPPRTGWPPAGKPTIGGCVAPWFIHRSFKCDGINSVPQLAMIPLVIETPFSLLVFTWMDALPPQRLYSGLKMCIPTSQRRRGRSSGRGLAQCHIHHPGTAVPTDQYDLASSNLGWLPNRYGDQKIGAHLTLVNREADEALGACAEN